VLPTIVLPTGETVLFDAADAEFILSLPWYRGPGNRVRNKRRGFLHRLLFAEQISAEAARLAIPECRVTCGFLDGDPFNCRRANLVVSPRANHPNDPVARFFAKVQITDHCWLWTGACHQIGGYGFFSAGDKQVLAHRFSYEHHRGPIPDGLHVCHSCDVPPCVNPQHLWLGTRSDNMQDAAQKGRLYGMKRVA
jgi:hypothetical protein